MALYAFDNKEKLGLPIRADQVPGEKKDSPTFYCTGENCPATMHLCSYKASNVKPPYFSKAPKSLPHIDGCPNDSHHKDVSNREKWYDQSFSYKEFLAALNTPAVKKNRQNTISQSPKEYPAFNSFKIKPLPYRLASVYKFCKGCSWREPFGSDSQSTIGLFCADTRSNQIFKNGIWGYHIIECLFDESSNKRYLRFHYPIDPTLPNQWNLIFRMPDDSFDLSNAFLRKLRGCHGPIVLMGEWRKEKWAGEFIITCNLTSLNQLYIPPNHG